MSRMGFSADFFPASVNNLPTVTVAMLVDYLAEQEVIYAPVAPKRLLRWFAIVNDDEGEGLRRPDIPIAQLLLICQVEQAERVLEENPQAFVLALCFEPSDCNDLAERCPERTLLVRQNDSYELFLLKIYSYFTKLLLWEVGLDQIVAKRGSLQDALAASEDVLKNFIFVSDNSFNVIAYTPGIEPPDEMHQSIVAQGCLTAGTINEKRYRLPEKDFYTKDPSELTPFSRLSGPIYLNHIYFGSFSMSCNNRPLTDGLKDLFTTFLNHVRPLCERMWKEQVRLNTPHYFFFEKMLSSKPMPPHYVLAQLSILGLDVHTEFKLVTIETNNYIEPKRAARAMKAAATLNQGDVFCFPYQQYVLAVLHSQPSDARLSQHATTRELKEKIYLPMGAVCGVSETFEDIADLDLAFLQTKIVLGLKQTLTSERLALEADGAASRDGKGVYLFGDAMTYYLVNPSVKDERFMRFCFHHTLVKKLYAEDKANGTNCTALLWHYLQTERNATETAKRLHMHRNTVLYHIEKIEKRFDIDFSWQVSREHMLLEYKAFFLSESENTSRDLFVSDAPL